MTARTATNARHSSVTQQQDTEQAEKPSRPPTAFERRLHEVCSSIPKGKVSTYGALAKVLKSSPRAVGQALRRNPLAPEVPCHRVVAASLDLGGFGGQWGACTPNVQRKKAMLEKEGVKFDGSRVADTAAVMGPGDF